FPRDKDLFAGKVKLRSVGAEVDDRVRLKAFLEPPIEGQIVVRRRRGARMDQRLILEVPAIGLRGAMNIAQLDGRQHDDLLPAALGHHQLSWRWAVCLLDKGAIFR